MWKAVFRSFTKLKLKCSAGFKVENLLEDTTLPIGDGGQRLKKPARCSAVAGFSPENCVLRYERPRRRHNQAINTKTRSRLDDRNGIVALEHLNEKKGHSPRQGQDRNCYVFHVAPNT